MEILFKGYNYAVVPRNFYVFLFLVTGSLTGSSKKNKILEI